MNFDLTEEQQLVVQTARDFAKREIEPPHGGWPTQWENPLMQSYFPFRAFLFTRS